MSNIIIVIASILQICANITIVISLFLIIRQAKSSRLANKISEKTLVIEKKHLTITFFDEINRDTKSLDDDLNIKKKELRISGDTVIMDTDSGSEDIEVRIRRYLSLMERLAVGIRLDIYDILIYDKLNGRATILMFKYLEEYIRNISDKYGFNFYSEFEWLAYQLSYIRSERKNGKELNEYIPFDLEQDEEKKAIAKEFMDNLR